MTITFTVRNLSAIQHRHPSPAYAPPLGDAEASELQVSPAYPDVVGWACTYPARPDSFPPALDGVLSGPVGWQCIMELIARGLFGSDGAFWEASRLPTKCLVAGFAPLYKSW